VNNLQTEWARLLIGSFADAGVRHVVLSPGSRSTPFVLAAARHPALTCYDVVDERSAAFFALGLARGTERPALLICTSGTAGANYLPAVIEARMSYVPLLVLTADRPLDLVGCGANQTIDQTKLYGDHVRRFFDLGSGDASPRSLRALRRTVAQAVAASLHPEPGAVHLNARAKKPLEPREAATEDERRLRDEVDALLDRPIAAASAPRLVPDPGVLDGLAAACREKARGLIVAGPAPLSQAGDAEAVFELAARTGFPVLADAASQLRYRGPRREDVLFVDGFGFLLADAAFRERHAPELVLQIGRAPTAAGWEKYLEDNLGCEHWLIGPQGWNDPQSTATHRLAADVGAVVAGLVRRLHGRASKSSWLESFREAEERQQQRIDGELDGEDVLSEGGVAREVVERLPKGALLVVGNSLPIREVDLYGRGGRADALVASQRGASGIDGVTSGAFGAAVAAGRPSVLLLGDVSFLHDLSGLAAARHVTVPFALVVVQNRGGRIFEMLPLAAHPEASGGVFDHWLTPHDHDFSHAAALFGLAFVRVGTRQSLREALEKALASQGVTVVEAVVPPHGAVEQNRRLGP
jgi:2-succinyl-5-enolpyruvyl-6-hydroxy-3-cyclohexene-1-carboxylate synthase